MFTQKQEQPRTSNEPAQSGRHRTHPLYSVRLTSLFCTYTYALQCRSQGQHIHVSPHEREKLTRGDETRFCPPFFFVGAVCLVVQGQLHSVAEITLHGERTARENGPPGEARYFIFRGEIPCDKSGAKGNYAASGIGTSGASGIRHQPRPCS